MRGRPAEAERWWVRSLDVYPANVRAHVFLGELYLGEGRADLAVEAFAAAVRLRPDKAEYRRLQKETGAAYRARMGAHYPAMVLVEVKSLLEDDAQVEIEATAIL